MIPDKLIQLMKIIPNSGSIAIFPCRSCKEDLEVTIEYYGKNYCGGLEQFCGRWRVKGIGLDDAISKAIDRLHKFLEENPEETEEE